MRLLRGKAAVLGTIRRLEHRHSPNVIHGALVGLAIHDPSIRPLGVDDGCLLLVPLADELLYFSFGSFFHLLMELVRRALAVPKDNIVIRGKALHVALKFVVVVPDDFVEEVLRAEHFIADRAQQVAHVPVAVEE